MTPSAPTIDDLLNSCKESAVHLEMRDIYSVDEETEEFEEWKRTGIRVEWDDHDSWWGPFYQAVSDAVARGVAVRRARVVSVPVTDYIRYEHDWTRANIITGEDVRWLPRRQATGIALPGNDFQLFDNHTLYINHFSGDGQPTEPEITEAPEVVQWCSSAFEAVWKHATPHNDFHI